MVLYLVGIMCAISYGDGNHTEIGEAEQASTLDTSDSSASWTSWTAIWISTIVIVGLCMTLTCGLLVWKGRSCCH